MTISKSEFLGLVRAESAARKSTAVLAEKEKLRNEIESELEKFLANGGQITTLKGTEIKPLPPRSIAEESHFITRSQFNSLFEWCKKRKSAQIKTQCYRRTHRIEQEQGFCMFDAQLYQSPHKTRICAN